MANEAGDGGGGAGPVTDLIWLLFFLFIVFVAWFAVGGPARADLGTLFLQSPGNIYNASSTPDGSASSVNWFPIKYPGAGDQTGATLQNGGAAFTDALNQLKNAPSPAEGTVTFSALFGAQETDPSREYVELQASFSNRTPLNISGWRIQSMKTGRIAVIGTAVETPLSGQGGSPGAVVLNPGERAEIVTGRSPIGVSFRVNKCSGYFAQFQTFNPPLIPQCPSAIGELYAFGGPLSSENACVSAAANISPCKVLTSLPSGTSPTCGQFLTTALSYNTCVGRHQSDSDFRQNEWRIYEGNTSELWTPSGDMLVLLDQRGQLVTSASY